MTTITDLLVRLDASYDAIPRSGGAVAERLGPFELFVRAGPGWPYYARPRLGSTRATGADVAAVRARQRELGVPEAVEWIDDLAPELAPVIEASGLAVLRAPLMVLDPHRLPAPGRLTPERCVLLDPDSPDFADLLAASSAIAALGFAAAGTQPGAVGPSERDAATKPLSATMVAAAAAGLRAGRTAEAVAFAAGIGMAARGAWQAAAGAAEIAGVATLPAARRRSLGAAVSALLARHAIDSGNQEVFLSAASEEVARVYGRIGFRRVGTACIASPHT